MKTPLEIKRGRAEQFFLQLTQGGEPMDITGLSLFFTCKQVQDDSAPIIFQKTLGSGIEFINSALGSFLVTIAPEDSESMSDLVTYFWEVLLVESSDFLIAPDTLEGPLTVTAALYIPA